LSYRQLRWLALLAVAVIAVLLSVAIGVRVAYGDRILPGTRMGGLKLGGLSKAAARERLRSAYTAKQSATLAAGGQRFVVTAAQAGYRVDVTASIEHARDAGREGPLAGLWSTVAALLTQRQLEPVARLQRDRLNARIAMIADVVDRSPGGFALVVDADDVQVGEQAPRAGRTLDRAVASAAAVAGLRDRRSVPIGLLMRAQPAVTRAEAQAVALLASNYLRTPLRLTDGPRKLVLTRRQTAGILALEATGGTRDARLRLGVDNGRTKRLVSSIARGLERTAVDARIRAPTRPSTLVEGQGELRQRPRRANIAVVPAISGRRLNRSAAASAVADAVRRGRHGVELELTRTSARFETAVARTITSLLSTFTTRFVCCQPRVTNIRLIAAEVDGAVVLPGERFSLNQATGKRTRADGYVEAPFIADGKIKPSIGGGVSQFSTTLYNAAYFAGLKIDSHRPHSFYIDRYPPGREATLNFPDIDLTWTNDTSAPVLIRAATDATSVSVSLYGADHGRRVRSQTADRTPVVDGDFAITVTRVLRYRDGKVAREPFTTRYDRPPPPE